MDSIAVDGVPAWMLEHGTILLRPRERLMARTIIGAELSIQSRVAGDAPLLWDLRDCQFTLQQYEVEWIPQCVTQIAGRRSRTAWVTRHETQCAMLTIIWTATDATWDWNWGVFTDLDEAENWCHGE